VEHLEKGVRPWVRPWNAEHAAGRITRPLRHNGQPLLRYRRSRQDEIATDIDTDNSTDERKPEQQLIGFRAVYIFDRLSRDLPLSLCAPDGFRQ